MKTFLIAALLLVPSFAEAAPIVRICQQVCYGDHCTQTWQTGTVVGRDPTTGHTVILTCAHGYEKAAKLYIQFEQGQEFEEASWKARDADNDLALILINHPASVLCWPISEADPKVNDTIGVGGFALAKTLSRRSTTIKAIHATTFEVDEAFSQGESGSPATIDTGVVGVESGNDVKTLKDGTAPDRRIANGHFTCLVRIRAFVNRALGRMPAYKRRQPAQPLVPVPQTEPLPPPTGQPQLNSLQPQIDALLARIAALEKQIAGVAASSGERGPQGEVGPAGKQGPPGTSVDTTVLAAIKTDIEALKLFHKNLVDSKITVPVVIPAK